MYKKIPRPSGRVKRPEEFEGTGCALGVGERSFINQTIT
jgi:hypothetical protein